MGRGMILVVHVHRLSVSNRMRIALYMSPIDPVLNQIRHGKVRRVFKFHVQPYCQNRHLASMYNYFETRPRYVGLELEKQAVTCTYKQNGKIT